MNRYVFFWALWGGLFFTSGEAHGQACTGCTFNIEVIGIQSGTFTPPEDAAVCLTGVGVFDGVINLEGNSTICIGQEVTYEYSSDDMWEGGWIVENHGAFKNSKEMEIQSGQTFNNYGHFEVVLLSAGTDNELVIREGGRLFNEGTVYVSGDIINEGELESTGTIELDNEFKNLTTGVATVSSVIGKGDMTNEGIINLYGIIESLEGAFYNNADGEIFGFGEPCSLIKAATEIENKGILDGSEGKIIIDAGDEFQDEGVEESIEVYLADSPEGRECLRILPVQWQDWDLYFSPKSRAVHLSWSTSNEWENNHFEIERSTGDTKHFDVMARVEGKGWTSSSTNYTFTDVELPLKGERMYYRIRQVDLGGGYSYSDVRSVWIDGPTVQDGVWKVYPNPIQGNEFFIGLTDQDAYQNEVIYLRLWSALKSSQKVFVPSISGLNEALSREAALFTHGMWVLEIQWGHQVQYIKILR